MNAQQARQKASSIKAGNNESHLGAIRSNIEVAAKRGDFKTHYYTSISDAVVKELEKDGFKVNEFFDQRDGVTITISWY